MSVSEPLYRRALIWLLVLGALLRVLGLNWDEGRALHPDEGNLVRAALTLGVGGRLIPEFHAYNDLSLWLPRLLSLPFCSGDDGACLTVVARALSAVFSVAMIPLAASIAQAMAGRLAGLVTAALVATSGALVQWAHFGTTESVIALMVLLIWWLCQLWQSGALRDTDFALLTATALGIGFGFKTTAALLAIMPIAAFALAGQVNAARWRLVALAGAVALVQALVFAPSVVFATRAWLDVMAFENGVVAGTERVFWTAQFYGARNGLFELRQLWSLTQGAGLLLALAGLALMPRTAWRLAAPGLVFAAIYAVLIFGWHAKFVRYLAPLMPVILILAGVGAARLFAVTRLRAPAYAGAAGVVVMAVAGIDHALAYLRPDPRIAMEERLVALSSPGDLVAIEPRDLPQLGGRRSTVLPLDAGTPHALVPALAQAEWLVVASRRNYAVLPQQPDAAPLICAYYAALADGRLGFYPVARMVRQGPLGRLFDPGLAGEETRVVFDRPEVFLFRNYARLSAEGLTQALSTPAAPESCDAATLERSWRRGA